MPILRSVGLRYGGAVAVPTYVDPPSGSSKVRDTSTYDAFGITYKRNGNLYYIARSGTTHLTGGSIILEKSVDSGASWGTRTTVYDSANDDRNLGGGILDAGTVLIGVEHYNSGHIESLPLRSTDGETFTAGSTFGAAGGAVFIPHGPIVDFGSGTAWLTGYTIDYTTCYYVETTDYGVTWGSPTALLAPAGTDLSEPAVLRISATQMLMVYRLGNGLGLAAASSTDDGATWTDLGDIFWFPKGAAPWLSLTTDGRVMLLVGNKTANGTLEISIADATEAISDANAFAAPELLYTGSNASGTGFGYFSNVRLGAYQLAIGYEGSSSDTDLIQVRFEEPAVGSEKALLAGDHFEDTDDTNITAHTPDVDTVGGGWIGKSAVTTHTISGNKARFLEVALVGIDAGNAVSRATARGVTHQTSNALPVLIVRDDGTAGSLENCWATYYHPVNNRVYLRSYSGGSVTAVTDAAQGTKPDVMEMRSYSDRVEVWIDGSLLITNSSTLHNTNTYAGLGNFSGSSGETRYESFEVVEL